MKELLETTDTTLNYGLPDWPKGGETAACSKSQWHRKIYTRTGDGGKTSLLGGRRVTKNDSRIEANGMIDELNSWIGYVRSINEDIAIDVILAGLQPRLNVICSDIAMPVQNGDANDKFLRTQSQWARELEVEMAHMEKDLEMLTHPALPGGSPAAASLHLARTVCRRAKLVLWLLQDAEGNVNPEVIRFVNRLSDFLFILAQWANLRFLKGDV